jgi:hypothetical protein
MSHVAGWLALPAFWRGGFGSTSHLFFPLRCWSCLSNCQGREVLRTALALQTLTLSLGPSASIAPGAGDATVNVLSRLTLLALFRVQHA